MMSTGYFKTVQLKQLGSFSNIIQNYAMSYAEWSATRSVV